MFGWEKTDVRNLFQINETNLIEHLTPSEWRHFVGPDTSEYTISYALVPHTDYKYLLLLLSLFCCLNAAARLLGRRRSVKA